MPILDSSFLIDLQRAKPHARAAFARLRRENAALRVPAQAALEFLSGFEDVETALARLKQAFHVVAFDEPRLRVAARMARAAITAGRRGSWADVQIAAEAVLESTFVVTANPAHFQALGVACWDYRDQREPPQSGHG